MLTFDADWSFFRPKRLTWSCRSKLGATARTADLVEEMGQAEIRERQRERMQRSVQLVLFVVKRPHQQTKVNFVFSDKTGTLTENEMVFAHCCASG